jgi:ADP-glucose pyrophosphorylase
MIAESKFNLGIIVGDTYSHFLSLDHYVNHFLMPFSPRFRNIDFSIASLAKIGIKEFFVFTEKDKAVIAGYLAKEWPGLHFEVFDVIDIKSEFVEYFNEFASHFKIEMIAVIQGDYPVWFDMVPMLKEIEKMKNGTFSVDFERSLIYPCIFVNRDKFKKHLHDLVRISNPDFGINQWVKEAHLKSLKLKNGYFIPQKNLKQYYKSHLGMIKDYTALDDYFCNVPITKEIKGSAVANLMRRSNVKNSVVGENVEINGKVENSVIFSGVKVQNGAYIKNSLVLPGNHIGHNVTIVNSIIDEFSGDNTLPNIDKNCTIGNEKPSEINRDFPEILNFGVTLVGKDVNIPSNTKIGGNCYIESFVTSSRIRSERGGVADGGSILL